MSSRVPADGARRRGTLKSRAVAGAQEIRTAEELSVSTSATVPSAGSGARSWGHARRAEQQRRRQGEAQRWSVILDAPHPLPVTSAELDVIETHLGDLLDELLASRPAA
ncbi:hypothetical protein [Aminobacter sp. J44]|uniref:hypothetical protein n=1 Tax=Aminobacter sp. J44 TaxID=935262 RepID=UPI0011A974F6|nr:hypothetical protein [Aminobacter sp. J44]